MSVHGHVASRARRALRRWARPPHDDAIPRARCPDGTADPARVASCPPGLDENAPAPALIAKRLPRVGGLFFDARAVARRELRHWAPPLRARPRTDHQDHDGALPAPTKACSVQGESGRSPRVGCVAPRPRRAACTPWTGRGTPPGSTRRGRGPVWPGSRTVTLIPSCGSSTGGSRYSLSKLHAAPPLREPPLGVAHVHDEPALGDGCEPWAGVLELRLGHDASPGALPARSHVRCSGGDPSPPHARARRRRSSSSPASRP